VKQCIFVDVKYEKSVMGFIDEYNSIDFSIHEDNELLSDLENILPQITCPACGEKIDLDYPKCPFCKHVL
jgi:Na+-translocating ferredoxin:NAD+ oxidoreductase RNF subunit RnfB